MAALSVTHIWRPLKNSTSTRLLVVHPASDIDAEISTTLTEVDLAEGPTYEAISWTWGNDLAQQPIRVNNQLTLIRENLWRFLKRLRRIDGRERVLWVDCLSINQTDNDEKSQQVAMIGEIFRKAESVVAWVGEAAAGSDELFRRLSQRRRLSYFENPKEYEKYEQQIAREAGVIDETQRVQEWKDFLERPWFSRVWIVQETVVAKQLLLHCGGSVIWWDQIPFFPLENGNFIPFDGIDAGRNFKNYPQVTLAFARLEELQRERDHFWNNRAGTDRFVWWGIHRIVESFSYRQCTDPRDRVYALLTLDQNKLAPDEVAIEPDYNLSAAEVFLSVFRQRYKTAWSMEPYQDSALAECDDAAELATLLASALGLGSAREAAELMRGSMTQSDDRKIWEATLRSLERSISGIRA